MSAHAKMGQSGTAALNLTAFKLESAQETLGLDLRHHLFSSLGKVIPSHCGIPAYSAQANWELNVKLAISVI